MNNFFYQALDFFRTSVKRIINRDSRKDLSDSVDATLVVFNNELMHIESGKTISVTEEYNVNDIAVASKQLLGSLVGQQLSIELLLPSGDFVATNHSLPQVSKSNLTSALQLQVESTHPSLGRPLAIAFDSSISSPESDTVVIWMEQELLDKLFDAFDGQGLFLACVKPRLLSLNAAENKNRFLEKDKINETLVVFERNVINSWKQVKKIDLEQKEFFDQWGQAIKANDRDSIKVLNEINQFGSLSDKFATTGYNYFPTGALDIRKKAEKGRRVIFATCIFVMFLFLFSTPFIKQSFEYRSAAASLEANRVMSSDARQDQQAVVGFEDQWGAINDFPNQVINEALFTLQNVLRPERISSIEISEGLIKLQGSSADPQAILQKLEQDPLFTEVLFSRATSNTRYYIDLRLSSVNFEAYMVRYFPDS